MTEQQQEADRERRAGALWDDLKQIRTPTLLMRGDWSKILAHAHAEEVVATMHDARLAVIPRATHNVHSDNPADFAGGLETFLGEVLP
jgi:pimeloyl-ACP methyl ester carboxylesterase